MRGATLVTASLTVSLTVSIHAPHARGDTLNKTYDLSSEVSIHAPHARGDLGRARPLLWLRGFNPRPSCEGRPVFCPVVKPLVWFQSTPLMRGATSRALVLAAEHLVSIHAPHARGDSRPRTRLTNRTCFNPRPSCEGRPRILATERQSSWFQSTPLMRGAT